MVFVDFIIFCLGLLFLLFLPGYSLILTIFKKNTYEIFNPLEVFIIIPGLSLIIFDFILILIGRAGLSINKHTIIGSIALFSLLCYLNYKLRAKKEESIDPGKGTPSLFNKYQTILVVLIIFLTIFTKTVYLKDAIFPTSTDLGHHMYWSKLVSQTGELPEYQKNEIVPINDSFEMKNEPIADFIIGEHLIFSGLNLITDLSFISSFPILILFFINIFSILGIFILAFRLFEILYSKKNKILNPANLSILTLFVAGPLHALSSPQSKFVSGGVIGNLIGNLLIPISLYFFLRAFKEKNPWLMFLGILSSAGIFYTHHLSGFIFIFIIVFVVILFNLIAISKIITQSKIDRKKSIIDFYQTSLKNLTSIILTPPVLILLASSIIFLLFIYTPSYISTNAQTTVVGAPSKSTRAGLTWEQFKYSVGELRLVFGFIGIATSYLFIFNKKRFANRYEIIALSIPMGWALAISLMTLKPQWLHINIPSDRVANYANFPFLILASLGLGILVSTLIRLNKKNILSQKIVLSFFILAITALTFEGFYDNSQSLSDNSKNQKALQTFHSSEFLSQQIKKYDASEEINVLKDHNYLSADSWIKLFFMHDYNYPLSRGYFKRYEDPTKPREMCTLWMINEPSSERSQKCFQGTQVKYIMVDTTVDGPQFKNNSQFNKIYESPSLSIFLKSQN